MHLNETLVSRDAGGGWKILFCGNDGDEVSVTVAGGQDLNADTALERARAIMVQLTAYGTRGGGGSVNAYDAASNGNFDEGKTVGGTRH